MDYEPVPVPIPLDSEGGLRAPPGLSFWGKAWWWFHFLILVKLARLRFLAILLAIGLVIVKWDTLVKHYERWTRPASAESAAAPDTEFFCPMHPAIVRDTAKEKCPICFMPLSKRKKGEAGGEALPPGIVSRVQLSPYRLVLAGVQTWRVAHVPLRKELNTVGFVEFNEREMKHVAARVKGRIDKLLVSETGQMVRAGDELASLYSPDLIVTVRNLLDARRANNPDLLAIAQDRLRLWGIDDDQIDEILKTGKANTHLRIRSPIDGHVVKKFVKEGQYVEEGSPLYDVVDLSSVWIQAQVYEDDMSYLPTGHFIKGQVPARDQLEVTATSRAYPNEKFTGKLAFVFPHVDLETRSVVIRFELPNPGHKLRPGTSVAVGLELKPARLPALTGAQRRQATARAAVDGAGRALAGGGLATPRPGIFEDAAELAMLDAGWILAVPESAVVDTGSEKLVYREHLPGEFEGVLVELGPRLEGPTGAPYYPVLGGLAAGDAVVTAGSFLIDAETRLNPAAGSIYIGGSSGSKTAAGAVRPSTPADQDAKLKAALAKLSDADRKLAEQQTFCPILANSRLGSMGVPVKLTIQGETVFLCCASCQDKALARPQDTVNKVRQLRQTRAAPAAGGEEAEIRAALAKLGDKDRAAAVAQRFCVVQRDNRLGSMGVPVKLMIQGQPVFLCCESCREEALAHPQLSLERAKRNPR
jgi:Cu(I)/Ag(I) efflux system membrane fusion protein